MSNGIQKLVSGHREVREVDLLSEFYEAWLTMHKRRHEEADREELENLAQSLLEAHTALTYYRTRHERH